MSPEQARGSGVDKRTDIWAFGCLLVRTAHAASAPLQGDTQRTRLRRCWNASRTGRLCPPKRPRNPRAVATVSAEGRGPPPGEYRGRPPHYRGSTEGKEPLASRGLCAAAARVAWRRRGPLVAQPGPPVRPLRVGAAHEVPRFGDPAGAFTRRPDGGVHSRPLHLLGPGQVYVKMLPDGEPVQLTHDTLPKMSPAFSPDGTRIAYTTD